MSCACQYELPLSVGSGRRVYTFYSQVEGLGEVKLLELWADSWRRAGWRPVILTPKQYSGHPLLGTLIRRVLTLPTANPRHYETLCYLRWLAYDLVAPGFFTDYDVMNYGLTPTMLPRLTEEHRTGLVSPRQDCHPDPGFFLASQTGIRRMLNAFLHDVPPIIDHNGQPHVSDMVYFHRLAELSHEPLGKIYGEPGWESAKCIHFARSAVGPGDRADFILQLKSKGLDPHPL